MFVVVVARCPPTKVSLAYDVAVFHERPKRLTSGDPTFDFTKRFDGIGYGKVCSWACTFGFFSAPLGGATIECCIERCS